jgi:cation:H+ antiporter
MPITLALVLFLVGLVVLVGGAEVFIRGAVRVARRFGVSPFLIGLTLVGFGTSAPELVVNLSAAAQGATGLAVGNVVGSNICNVGLILGLAALVRSLDGQMRLLKVEVPVLLAVSAAAWVMAHDREISRADGLILLAGFAGMMLYLSRSARREPAEVKAEFREAAAEATGPAWATGLFVVLGLGLLVGGAHLMVESAVEIARTVGVSDEVIGLTVVAVGTSLPELASSLAAAWRGQDDIALGNVVGSNVFNLLLILGLTAAITPLPVPDGVARLDLPVMNLFAWALVPVLVNGLRVYRWEGAILLAGFVAFTGWQAVRAQSP